MSAVHICAANKKEVEICIPCLEWNVFTLPWFPSEHLFLFVFLSHAPKIKWVGFFGLFLLSSLFAFLVIIWIGSSSSMLPNPWSSASLIKPTSVDDKIGVNNDALESEITRWDWSSFILLAIFCLWHHQTAYCVRVVSLCSYGMYFQCSTNLRLSFVVVVFRVDYKVCVENPIVSW